MESTSASGRWRGGRTRRKILISTRLDAFYIHFHEDALVGRMAADVVVDEAGQIHEGHLDALAGFVRGAAPLHTEPPVVVRAAVGPHEGQLGVGRAGADRREDGDVRKCVIMVIVRSCYRFC